MVDQFRLHRTRGTKLIDSLVHGAPNDCECNVPAITVRPECRRNHGPDAPLEEWEAEDDVKGGPLDPREVKAARQKELQYLWDMEVYEYSTEAEVRARTGRNPVGLMWIDTNKGSAEAPRYGSRLVCTEVRHKEIEPIFSAPPPLETLRVLLCVACQEDVFRVEDPSLISIADVSRAHFYADAVCVMSTFDCRTTTPKQSTQACVGNCERQCADPWMQHNGGESIALKPWSLEDFP